MYERKINLMAGQIPVSQCAQLRYEFEFILLIELFGLFEKICEIGEDIMKNIFFLGNQI